jgi:hypothetical protein
VLAICSRERLKQHSEVKIQEQKKLNIEKLSNQDVNPSVSRPSGDSNLNSSHKYNVVDGSKNVSHIQVMNTVQNLAENKQPPHPPPSFTPFSGRSFLSFENFLDFYVELTTLLSMWSQDVCGEGKFLFVYFFLYHFFKLFFF